MIKPFLKWAGGKRQLLLEIKNRYPFGTAEINTYIEPFLGGGATLFDILRTEKLKNVIANDINSELINAYIAVRDNPKDLIASLKHMQREFLEADQLQKVSYFQNQRSLFNQLIDQKLVGLSIEKASLLIFLNKTCFNGLYRVNKDGHFNVPIGSYQNILICDEQTIMDDSEALKDVTFLCGDYSHTKCYLGGHTFIYIDPPYKPISVTSSFNSYSKESFTDQQQVELYEFCAYADRAQSFFMLSNSAPNDGFFENLYRDFKIEYVNANRCINANSDRRGEVQEILITNY